MEQKSIETVLSERTESLMSIDGVVGTGVGSAEGQPCILVFVKKKSSVVMKKIPVELDGWKVIIQEVGKVKALS